jgi:exodeoxyribonuclease III
LERLRDRASELRTFEEPAALMGDFNVIPEPDDCHDPAAWMNDALYQPESRAALRRVENLGWQDAFRACNVQPNKYTFWDYQAGAWQKDHGIRIDLVPLSPQALDRLKTCAIEKRVRGWDKPSDHVPVWCEIEV